MSQRDGFTGGLLLGALVGGVVGGVVGALAASRQNSPEEKNNAFLEEENPDGGENPEERIETARRSLEGKIAQLNLAIDDVRQQLSSVNGNHTEQEDA
ncbi:hypothetical protein PN462_18610 [Spirulina sp. CS-785/01]|uniref:hypothetical protein n=1 Tax=Spirulina sp. CS-785/01 TaxID=3021716 RepID=UPI00232CDA75|nr:hypothetical protein [Spirulina sp. CS-785/01]MDB9315134.1 hypothetical protein [Spirulina sp. CS-785/01]